MTQIWKSFSQSYQNPCYGQFWVSKLGICGIFWALKIWLWPNKRFLHQKCGQNFNFSSFELSIMNIFGIFERLKYLKLVNWAFECPFYLVNSRIPRFWLSKVAKIWIYFMKDCLDLGHCIPFLIIEIIHTFLEGLSLRSYVVSYAIRSPHTLCSKIGRSYNSSDSTRTFSKSRFGWCV